MRTFFAGTAVLLTCLFISAGYNKVNEPNKHSALPVIKNEVLISDYTKSYLAFNSKNIALTDVKIIDGTGKSPVENQIVLIRNGYIDEVGHKDDLTNLEEYQILSLEGHTVIPGIVGTHNHMRLPQGAMLYTSPKLYLACGVTTIQTCGTGNPHEEIEIGKAIKQGFQPGAEIVNSSPYFTGRGGRSNFISFTTEENIRDSVRYWAYKGVQWFKVYVDTRPEDLKIIVDEAHKNGAKVTGHLCATTFEEAAMAGIDAIEHGFIHSYDHAKGRTSGVCSGSRDFRSELDLQSKEVNRIQQLLIENNVAISSTPAIFEAQTLRRGKADKRTLQALEPFHIEAYHNRRKRMAEAKSEWYFKEEWLKRSLEYELAFFRAGGLLTAGPDPGLHNLPGYGDQRNYELFVEAGFKPEEAIQIMTFNGARLLGKDEIGSIAAGKLANLVVLKGDLVEDPTVIQNVEFVLKEGLAYDPAKLAAAVKGHTGSEHDDLLKYLGQKKPGINPEIFAPNLISKREEHEFGSVFSKDGTEFYYGVDVGGKAEIRFTALEKGVWTPPEPLIAHDAFSFNDPFLSNDEERLYYISDMPRHGSGESDYDIWYSTRNDSGWSEPVNAGDSINTEANEYYISFTNDDSMYFASNFATGENRKYNYDLYRSQFENGVFKAPARLGENINSRYYEADVFVAPDESYMIFSSVRREGHGQGDLYISFKDKNGNWAEAKNMGGLINTEGHELCPFVTKDGKYFLYTSDKDIYWVDAGILKNYK